MPASSRCPSLTSALIAGHYRAAGTSAGRADRSRREQAKTAYPERARCMPPGPALRSVAATPGGQQRPGKNVAGPARAERLEVPRSPSRATARAARPMRPCPASPAPAPQPAAGRPLAAVAPDLRCPAAADPRTAHRAGHRGAAAGSLPGSRPGAPAWLCRQRSQRSSIHRCRSYQERAERRIFACVGLAAYWVFRGQIARFWRASVPGRLCIVSGSTFRKKPSPLLPRGSPVCSAGATRPERLGRRWRP